MKKVIAKLCHRQFKLEDNEIVETLRDYNQIFYNANPTKNIAMYRYNENTKMLVKRTQEDLQAELEE